MIRGINHVAVHTANFDRMVEFYVNAFGFTPAIEVGSWRDNPDVDGMIGVPGSAARVMVLKAGNAYLEIFEYFSPPARPGAPLRPHDHGYTHFCVDVTDFDADLRRLKEAGMRFVDTVPFAMGKVCAVYGKDPDGNLIEVQWTTPDHPYALEGLPAVELGGR